MSQESRAAFESVMDQRAVEIKDLRRRLDKALEIAEAGKAITTMRFTVDDLARLTNAVYKVYDPEVEKAHEWIKDAVKTIRAAKTEPRNGTQGDI